MHGTIAPPRCQDAGETLEPPRKEQGVTPSPAVTARATIEAMCTDPAPERVWIEVDPAAEPIAGLIHHGAAPARPFAGWLELVALLESERRPPTESEPTRPAADAP